MEELPLRDVPQELREEIAKYISDFTVGFVKLRDTDFDQEAELGGSGTLVQIDDVYGVLTAYHVLKNLPDTGDIGLILPTRSQPQLHASKIKGEVVQKVKVAHRKTQLKVRI